MPDPILTGFLITAEANATRVNAESDIVRIVPDHGTGRPPRVYHGLLKHVEHFARDAGGGYRVVSDPIRFEIRFSDDYCKSVDSSLQFRVVRTDAGLVHPNVSGEVVCLGGAFRPATPLRSVVDTFYRIASGRVAATDHPFDLEAASFFRQSVDRVRALEAAPLWRQPLARSVRVEDRNASGASAERSGA